MFDTGGAAQGARRSIGGSVTPLRTIEHLLFNDGVLEELGGMALGDEVATRFV